MKKWAVIDIGSNTIRLVIYKENCYGVLKEGENIKSVARLRTYLNKDQILAEEGITKLITILKGFMEILQFHKVSHVKCVATATIRQAQNKQEIIKRVKMETNFEIEILSEREEAYYGFYAISQTTAISEGVSIDIGGGSTEITYFKGRKLIHYHSFPFGVVSLKEQFIKGDKLTDQEREPLKRFLINSFNQLDWLKSLKVPIVAIGGSARNIAQIDQSFKNYPLAGIHQYTMNHQDLLTVKTYMDSMKITELEKLDGLSKDRADIIMPALEVFLQLYEHVQAPYFMFSRKGLRDGLFLEKFPTNKTSTKRNEIVKNSLQELVIDYGVDQIHSEHVSLLAKQLYKEMASICGASLNEQYLQMIDFSARVYFIGQYMDADISSQHTFYLLANHPINGLNHKERLVLALISSFKNKALLKQYSNPFVQWFSKEELDHIRMAGSIVKLAAALDASKRGIVKSVWLVQENELTTKLTAKCSGNFFVEKYQTEKQIRHFEKAMKTNITIHFENSH